MMWWNKKYTFHDRNLVDEGQPEDVLIVAPGIFKSSDVCIEINGKKCNVDALDLVRAILDIRADAINRRKKYER